MLSSACFLPSAATLVQPQRLLIGENRTPLLIVDDTGVDCRAVCTLASALTPFPPAGNHYPGVRRILNEGDSEAWEYVLALLGHMTPYIVGAFDLEGFDLLEASFSLVTTPPDRLSPVQRAPHFDSVDADVFALMHYLAPCAGTAFYRHCETGIEVVTPERLDAYVSAARRAAADMPVDYIRGDLGGYRQIAVVEGLEGRFVGYPGRLLHSGMIPPGFAGSADPLTGRLTCNIFIRGRRHG